MHLKLVRQVGTCYSTRESWSSIVHLELSFVEAFLLLLFAASFPPTSDSPE